MLKISEKDKYLAFALLIGGKSTRFGSDKGLFKFKGKSLIMREIEAIRSISEDIFLVSHGQSQIDNYKKELKDLRRDSFIIDDKKYLKDNINAPMIGFYTIFEFLSRLSFEKVFVLSCDIPFIQPNVVKAMIQNSEGFDCCMPNWKNGFLEPLFAIYPVVKGFRKARKCLERKELKLLNVLSSKWKINYLSVEEVIQPLDPELLTFTNINRVSDLEKLKERILE